MASGDVFERLDLPREEHDPTDLIATRERVQLHPRAAGRPGAPRARPGGTGAITNTIGTLLVPYTYLERNVTLAVDGESTPAIQTSGTEEFFFGGGYYESSPGYSTPWAMITAANNANATVDQGLDLLTLCGGVPFASAFVWALGTEAAVQAAHQMSYCALYYKNV
jgi:hypothetical protein